jgi:hypothetical protein
VPTSRYASAFLVGIAAALLGGCAQHKPVPEPLPTIEPPSARAFAAAHNARVAPIARLWSRTTLWIRGTDARGEPLDENVEGHLMLELPRNLSLTVKKLGETYFVLGSSADQYWWFDLSADPRTALVGVHAQATRERVRDFGLPVLPLELIELLAITPIDEAALTDPRTTVRWVSAREAEATFPMPAGTRTIRFGRSSLEPSRVELRDDKGRVVAAADLSGFEPTPVRGVGGDGPRFQRRVDAYLPEIAGLSAGGTRIRVTIDLFEPENRPINPANFDLRELLTRHRVASLSPIDPAPENAP